MADGEAGFRPEQECVCQVGALIEILQRWTLPMREAKGGKILEGDEWRSYVCFVDFKKAYDMVPHEAMLYKLRAYGISGRTYNFIRTLYDGSSISVRVGHLYSPIVPLERGLRQGCPLSPILFSIFINDILPKPMKREFPWEPKVEGLMFADDIVVFARTADRLQFLLDRISEWSNTWEMQVGHAKCGVMLLGAARTEANIDKREWILQGKPISVVAEYTYLGVKITPELKETMMRDARVEKMKMILGKQQRFLCNYRIPAQMGLMVLQSIVLTSGLYGWEVCGGAISESSAVHSVLNMGLRFILLGKALNATSICVMQLEMDMPPVYLDLIGKRLRPFDVEREEVEPYAL